MSKCKTCEYRWLEMGAHIWCCDYICITGKRRPCPPGRNCTVYEPYTGKYDRFRPEGPVVKRNIIVKKAKPLYESGMNDAEIARALGVAPSSVYSWRIRNHLPSNHISGTEPKVDYGKVQLLYEQGSTDREIAETVGCSKQTVAIWRRKNLLPARKKASS